MSVLVNNTNGTSADSLLLASIAGGVNLRSNHTITMRARFNTLGTSDEFGVAWTANANISGSYVGRQSGETAGRWSMYRSSSTGFTVEECPTTGYVADGVWRHFAMTYDGTNIRSYIDGVLQNTVASTLTRVTDTTATTITLALGGRYVMCDVMFFNRQLTAEELAKLSRQRSPAGIARGSDLFAWYPLFADDFLRDYSGVGNTLAPNAGTGTAPAADNEDPGVPWGPRRSRIVVPNAVPIAITGDGTTNTSGAGTLAKGIAITGAGASVTDGAATLAKAIAVAGTGATTTAGAATLAKAVAMAATGAAVTDGAGTLAKAIPLSGGGQAVTDGSAVLGKGIAITGDGETETEGDGTLSSATVTAITGAGATVTDAAGQLVAAAALAGSGETVTAGAGLAVAAGAVSGVGATVTDASGSLGKLVLLSGAGATTTDGSGAAVAAGALSGAAQTVTDGSGVISLASVLAGDGLTITGGFGTLSGGTPADDGLGDALAEFQRRMVAVAARRRAR